MRTLASWTPATGAARGAPANRPDGSRRVTPEYDDLKRIAAANNIPLKALYDEIIRSFEK